MVLMMSTSLLLLYVRLLLLQVDHAVLPMVRSMFAILFGRECVQCADDASCRRM